MTLSKAMRKSARLLMVVGHCYGFIQELLLMQKCNRAT